MTPAGRSPNAGPRLQCVGSFQAFRVHMHHSTTLRFQPHALAVAVMEGGICACACPQNTAGVPGPCADHRPALKIRRTLCPQQGLPRQPATSLSAGSQLADPTSAPDRAAGDAGASAHALFYSGLLSQDPAAWADGTGMPTAVRPPAAADRAVVMGKKSLPGFECWSGGLEDAWVVLWLFILMSQTLMRL